jgi:ammonia channel protein AmtB
MTGLIAGVTFYALGYSFAFSVSKDGSRNAFMGTGDFSLGDTAASGAWHSLFFHRAVVAAVITDVARGIAAERCRVEAHAIFIIWISTNVCPVAAKPSQRT